MPTELLWASMTPAGFSKTDRKKRFNTFPILLTPHGSTFEDVVDTLRCLIPFDKGKYVTIRGEKILLCAFTFSYIGDMPQQNANSGCLGPTGSKYCRFCYIGKKQTVQGHETGDGR